VLRAEAGKWWRCRRRLNDRGVEASFSARRPFPIGPFTRPHDPRGAGAGLHRLRARPSIQIELGAPVAVEATADRGGDVRRAPPRTGAQACGAALAGRSTPYDPAAAGQRGCRRMSDRQDCDRGGVVVHGGRQSDAARRPARRRQPWDGPAGRFLPRAAAEPGRRFLGIELAREYFRLAAGRLVRRRLANLALLRGEALALLATELPRGFASALHVYFPDPWPKSRHQKRRLFSAESVDLLLGAVAPSGALYFATDHLDYGGEVRALLESYPGLAVVERAGGWPEGARTNYEAKFVAAGRPILRLEARIVGALELHPRGERHPGCGGRPLSETLTVA
jgi:tRNA (guanine-N7-)-methyltransferase